MMHISAAWCSYWWLWTWSVLPSSASFTVCIILIGCTKSNMQKHMRTKIYIYTWMYTRTHATTHACVHTCTQTTATDRSQDRQVKWRQTTPVYSLAPIFTCLAMTPNLLAKPALLSLLSLQPLSQNCHTQSLILTIHTKYWNRVSLSPKPSGRISYITNRCKMASTMQSHLA